MVEREYSVSPLDRRRSPGSPVVAGRPDQMAQRDLRFRFSTALLRRLGEELNPSLERGLIELVKNAYDADATECTIELQDVDEPGGEVTVSDNGCGMSADA